MHISEATVDDSRAVAEIHVAAWKSAYADIMPAEYLADLSVDSREAIWRAELSRDPQRVALVKADEQVLGWIFWGASRDADVDPNTAEIWAINVSPDCWSRGVGRLLILHVRSHLAMAGYQAVNLWVLERNVRAIGFYRQMGFVPDTIDPKQIEIGGALLTEIRYVLQLTAH
jgi:ribosomal protein S18 acetylase RimI-like enzyme